MTNLSTDTKPTQRNAILNHFIRNGSLTTTEAYEMYGCTSLRARVSDFKKLGHRFSKKMEAHHTRFGTTGEHARYFYEGREIDGE